jgi:hypothetical protein
MNFGLVKQLLYTSQNKKIWMDGIGMFYFAAGFMIAAFLQQVRTAKSMAAITVGMKKII